MPFFRKLFGLEKKNISRSRVKPVKSTPADHPSNSASPAGNLGKVFKELDCPVCFNTCVPPIHSCINGHIICNTCRSNVKQCPSCRHGFSGTRNFFAENFITNCSQKCLFAKEGCEYLRLKGDNMMRPHEQQCMFRPIRCVIPTCDQELAYHSLLKHLIFNHKIYGTENSPAIITYHAEQPLMNNRKWLPYYIEAYENIFYVMCEIVRPNFFVWIYLQTTKVEDSFESMFTSRILINNDEKKLKLMWEGPVQSIRTSDKMIMKDGLCFVAHEVFLQHFNSDGYFTLSVDIKKVPRRNVNDLKTLSASCINNPPDVSTLTLYDSSLLNESNMNENENGNSGIIQANSNAYPTKS